VLLGCSTTPGASFSASADPPQKKETPSGRTSAGLHAVAVRSADGQVSPRTRGRATCTATRPIVYKASPGDQIMLRHRRTALAHRREGDPPRPSTSRSRASSTNAGVTRPAAVYRANPFVIEAGPGLRQGPGPCGGRHRDAPDSLSRGRGADTTTSWPASSVTPIASPLPTSICHARLQGRALDAPGFTTGGPVPRALPAGPMVIFQFHMCSVLGHFTSESKERSPIRRDPKDSSSRAGVRAPAGMFLVAASGPRARFRRAQHLRAVHRGGPSACGRLRRQAAQDKLKGSSRRSRSSGPVSPRHRRDPLGRDNGPRRLPHSIIVTLTP